MKRIMRSIAGMLLIATMAAPLPAAAQMAKVSRADYEAILKDPTNLALFESFVAKLPSVVVEHEGVRRSLYLLEGDLLLTKEKVYAAILSHAEGSQPVKPTGELKVMTEGGNPVFWPKGSRSLTFAVNKASFSPDAYSIVVANMRAAAKEWENACPECGLSIAHKEEYDANPTLQSVTFIVTMKPDETSFIAASFFPNDPIFRRYLFVAPSYFTTDFDKTGVFRHELGHVIGYRHEHIKGVPGCFSEDGNWKPLTKYDPHSVMHYFCGGGGSMQLTLSDIDVQGHRDLYR
jgi:hypothetical protein